MAEGPERYQEFIECEAVEDEGVIFIKVVALPLTGSVEFDATQARNFALRILEAVERVENRLALWGKSSNS